jgi:hypothetical protein
VVVAPPRLRAGLGAACGGSGVFAAALRVRTVRGFCAADRASLLDVVVVLRAAGLGRFVAATRTCAFERVGDFVVETAGVFSVCPRPLGAVARGFAAAAPALLGFEGIGSVGFVRLAAPSVDRFFGATGVRVVEARVVVVFFVISTLVHRPIRTSVLGAQFTHLASVR